MPTATIKSGVLALVLALAATLTLPGAALAKFDIWVSPELAKKEIKVYAVLSMENTATADPELSGPLREAMETMLLEEGYKAVARAQVEKVLAEQSLSLSGITETQSAQVGKLLNTDAIVVGTIAPNQILVKAIEVKTGEIIWKGVAHLTPRLGRLLGLANHGRVRLNAAALARKLARAMKNLPEEEEAEEAKPEGE